MCFVQLREMEQVVNAWTAAWASSEMLQKCLCELASSENPGATVSALQAEPCKDANGEVWGGDQSWQQLPVRPAQPPAAAQTATAMLAAAGCWRQLAASSGSRQLPCSLPEAQFTVSPSHHPSSVQEYVKFDAIIVAGDTAYVGDMDTVLGEDSVHRMALKAIKLR